MTPRSFEEETVSLTIKLVKKIKSSVVNVIFLIQVRASYIQFLEFGKKRNERAGVCNEKVNIENAIKHPEEMVGTEEDYFLSLEISVGLFARTLQVLNYYGVLLHLVV